MHANRVHLVYYLIESFLFLFDYHRHICVPTRTRSEYVFDEDLQRVSIHLCQCSENVYVRHRLAGMPLDRRSVLGFCTRTKKVIQMKVYCLHHHVLFSTHPNLTKLVHNLVTRCRARYSIESSAILSYKFGVRWQLIGQETIYQNQTDMGDVASLMS